MSVLPVTEPHSERECAFTEGDMRGTWHCPEPAVAEIEMRDGPEEVTVVYACEIHARHHRHLSTFRGFDRDCDGTVYEVWKSPRT